MLRKHLPDGSTLRYEYNGPLHAKPGVLSAIYKEGVLDRPLMTGLNRAEERYQDQSFVFGNGLTQRRVLDTDGKLVSEGNPQVGESHLDWTHGSGSPAGSPASYTRTVSGGAAAADFMPSFGARAAARIDAFAAEDHETALPARYEQYFAAAAVFNVRGELIQDSQRRYEWDALGRLTRITAREGSDFIKAGYAPAASPPRTLAEYRYNLFGERIAKRTFGSAGEQLTYFVWDGAELAAEIDQSGRTTRDYVYLQGRPIAMLEGRSIFAIHTDHRNAPIAVTDANRRVVWQADVHDYGAAQVSPASRIEMPLRASNQYFDAETGLHYNLYRYLDPERGRYISPDPMGLAAGPDLYQFALGQPHRYIDPLGLQAVDAGGEVPDNTDVSKWSLGQRLTAVFTLAGKSLPADLRKELLSLVSPQAIGGTVAVLGLWSVSQAFGVGEVFDVGAMAVMYATLGPQALDMIKGLVVAVRQMSSAQCYRDFRSPAATLSSALSATAGAVASAVVLHKLIGGTEENLGAKGEGVIDAEAGIKPNGDPITKPGGEETLPANNDESPFVNPFRQFSDLIGETLTGKPVYNDTAPPGSRVNNGVLGEQSAQQILKDETGLDFNTFRNGSNNGPDWVAVEPGKPPTIIMVEAKSTIGGSLDAANTPTGSGVKKLEDWINEAADRGTINGKKITDDAQIAFAKKLQNLLNNQGATIQSTFMKIKVPPPGEAGVPVARISPWP